MENQGGTPLSCPLCSANFSSESESEKHRSNPEHIYRWLKHWYYNNKVILGQDKNNVKISVKHKENIGVLDSTIHVDIVEGEKVDVVMTVENNASESTYLRKIGLLNPTNSISVHDKHEVAQEKRCVKINPGVMYEVTASVTGMELGVTEVPIAFQLRMENTTQLFFIVKTMVLSVEDAIAKDCVAEEPYIENKLRYSVVPLYNEPYERGVPPPFEIEDSLKRNDPLKQHHYSYDLVDIANKNFNSRKLVGSKRAEAHRITAMLNTGLTIETYREWFQTMLWLEEMQVRADFTSYNMESACLTQVTQDPFRHCIALQVPGLAENRPSVLRGDSVFVKSEQNEKFEGRVHHVVENQVYLGFGPKFMKKFINSMKVSVEFSFCRLPLRCAHEAVCMAERNKLEYLLFPTKPTSNMLPPAIKTKNRHVEENPEQLQAVRQILCKSSLPGPYVIFGPPGTGKTITIVEAMKQVYTRNSESRILACAPSNTAADLITSRLLEHVLPRDILRIYAVSRFLDDIPDKLKGVSNIRKGLYYPSVEVLKAYRIIVCTLVTSSRLVGANFPDNHFSYIFVDESGQATEAEAMIPIAGLATRNTQVVLAGDPQQLGPVIRNTKCFSSERFFTRNGLDKSYLERLMEMEMFKSEDGVYDARVVTKLLNNYRSHEAILKLSNDLFYQSELKMCADRVLTGSLCNWGELPKRNFPMIFKGIKGKDEKESFSPSYFNAQEVSAVISYIKKILEIKTPQIHGRDIGVITPYRRQVQKIRKQVYKNLPERHWTDLKVGTPEEFQGNERKVIIISTVRATASYLGEDNKFKIGFLKNPKRFNVAVTRAKALLIVVGQAEVLQFDPYWGKLYSYIKDQGGYIGPKVSKEPDNFEEIIRCFSQLNIGLKSFENISEPSGRELAEAPGWGANI